MRKKTAVTEQSKANLSQNARESGGLNTPGAQRHPWEEHSSQSRQLSQQHRERERDRAVSTHSPRLQEQDGNPLGGWTDAHPKKISISVLPIKM